MRSFIAALAGGVRDLAPIVVVIAFFQIVVLRQAPPALWQILAGFPLVLLGLVFFVRGLQQALFPLGETLAFAFARRGSLGWLLVFAFALGCATTIAEPALIAVAREAADVAAQTGFVAADEAARAAYAFGLRVTVALSVGFAIALGVVRIIRGWPLHYLIIGGYLGVLVMTALAPPEIVGVAYDSGGVTTSTVTVPLVTALGVGLAASIRGRNPLVDGFGLIALASLTPVIFVLGYGMLV